MTKQAKNGEIKMENLTKNRLKRFETWHTLIALEIALISLWFFVNQICEYKDKKEVKN
jgi:hypothetical protein